MSSSYSLTFLDNSVDLTFDFWCDSDNTNSNLAIDLGFLFLTDEFLGVDLTDFGESGLTFLVESKADFRVLVL